MNSTELQEKLNTYNARKQSLRTHAWYRAIEVIYYSAAVVLGLLVLIIAGTAGDQGPGIFFWGFVILITIFWLIKKGALYILLGSVNTIRPEPEHTLESRLKK